ncbi:hypothetical protein Dda_3734 [Drechslerella dactyloides]|uniref:Dopey N-terminal domain-containing protein n=1 Tax=Drechslerella dactyloides TaxID=74499 RepID=A0AAD6NJT4_DREDA|nr:hypothetical protein Dda_3734 [Drechslerella dactyloides]
MKKDPRQFKKYAAGVERALALFENTIQEWADYISFLGRLHKAIQANHSLAVIPAKSVVSKRLAQCLNARLPSGVHQKALEVYSSVFSIIGQEGLARDLATWTPGLAPLLSYAAISVRPYLLTILETYYLPLAKSLRPALRSLILAILPGIDEEGSEFFDRTFALLESVRTNIDEDAYFWQCFLLASMSSPGRRQGALAYLSRKMPNLGSEDALTSPLVTPEPGLLIRCFSTGLLDDQLLVQRGFLDVLVQNLPLSSPILQKLVTAKDREKLLVSACTVVLRRDMSLNRRLWVWLLGPDQSDAASSPISTMADENSYFSLNGLDSLCQGLSERILLQKSDPVEMARPYRILLSLMDRWEIGGSVIPKLFFPAMQSAQQYEKLAPSPEKYQEVLRSAAQFFDGVEPGLVWSELVEMLLTSLGSKYYPLLKPDEAFERLHVARYVLKTFNVQEEEMVIIYAPLVLLSIIAEAKRTDNPAAKGNKVIWGVASDLIDLIPERAFTSTMVKDECDVDLDADSILSRVARFFSLDSKKKTAFPPFSTKLCGHLILHQFADLTAEALKSNEANIPSASRFLVKVLSKISFDSTFHPHALLESIHIILKNPKASFGSIASAADLLATLIEKGYSTASATKSLAIPFVTALWAELSPDTPRHHVEATRAIWGLQASFKDRRIEAAICSLMVESGVHTSAEPGRRYAVLWSHSSHFPDYKMVLSRPLFLLLDALNENDEERNVQSRGWLQNLASTDRLFDIILSKILQFPFIGLPLPNSAKIAAKDQDITDDTDIEMCIYYFQTLNNVLRYATEAVLASIAEDHLASFAWLHEYLDDAITEETITLQMVFAELSYFVVTKFPGESANESLVRSVARLHRAALAVLHQLLLSPYSTALADLELELKLTKRLDDSLKAGDTFVQVAILDVLFASLKLSLRRSDSQLSLLSAQLKPPPSRDSKGSLRLSNTAELEKEMAMAQPNPPHELIHVLIEGLSSDSTRPVLDSWINFLTECLPFLSPVIFQILLPLVECMCKQIRQTFELLKNQFQELGAPINTPETTLVAMLNGLEHLIAAAHDQIMVAEVRSAIPKTPHENTSFFGNMVSNVFTNETAIVKNVKANNRLTVLLCFQDTVRICFSIWSWGDLSSKFTSEDSCSASYGYTSSRLRARARRILEHLYQVETLECLETFIEMWKIKPLGKNNAIFKLINVLDASRPKHTIGAIFNSIFSRTNAAALEQSRRSSLTSELTDLDVAAFLVDYVKSLEDDAMEEIWTDCLLFLSDVLKNPFPHRQTIPLLLHFTAIIGEKVDNTIFGEQKKMRKELGDIFIRILSSVFTLRPAAGILPDASTMGDRRPSEIEPAPDDITAILNNIVPKLRKILVEPERTVAVVTTIITSLVSPALRSKSFPVALPRSLLEIVYNITKIPNTQKLWRKEISDAFNDTRFFTASVPSVKNFWKPLLRQWIISDKERMLDLFAKITPPATAGVFGVGAASARAEADKRIGSVLRRMTILLLAGDKDYFVVYLQEFEVKLLEVLSATAITSPSAATRCEVYLLLRALVLRTSSIHLTSFWPIIVSELQNLLMSLTNHPSARESGQDSYTHGSLLEGCKLLDTLLVVQPDEWQLNEWLFITDTVEAVYKPDYSVDVPSIALADYVSRELSENKTRARRSDSIDIVSSEGGGFRRLMIYERDGSLLNGPGGGGAEVTKVTTRFLRYLSIWNFENTYGMGKVDEEGLEDAILADLPLVAMDSDFPFSPAVIARLQDLSSTPFLRTALINNYPRPTETHLDTVAAAEAQHQSSVTEDVKTLDELIKKQEAAIRGLQAQIDALHTRDDATPQKIDAARKHALKDGSERFFAELPWLPEEESGLNTLLAVRSVLRVIEESRKEITETERRVEEAKQTLRREQGWVATAQELEKELKRRAAELEKLSRVNMSQDARDKRKLTEYEKTRKDMISMSAKLAKDLAKFVRERLGVMLAVEEAGGPVVGSELDLQNLRQYLEVDDGSTGRRNKAAKARERGQRRLDEIWGGGNADGEETGESADPENKAGEELLELIETMLNKMLEDNTHAYTKLSRDSAASRFLVRSFAASLHPKDAIKIRLLDFGGRIKE